MLWGLLGLLLPVIIHLFSLRRARKLDFSHFLLLEQVVRRTHRRRQLKEWLLLALRLMALSCLVFAFAKPYFPSMRLKEGVKQVLFALDNSYSMSLRSAEGPSVLDKAVQVVGRLADNYATGTGFYLLSNGRGLSPLLGHETLDEALAKVRYSGQQLQGTAVQAAATYLSASSLDTMDVYWLSDFQQDLLEKEPITDSLNRWHVLPFALPYKETLYIDSLYSPAPAWVINRPGKLCARIKNDRSVPCNPCTIKLIVGETQRALLAPTLAPKASTTICFDYTPRQGSSPEVTLQLEDKQVPFDNKRYMVLNWAQARAILEIASSQAPRYLEQAYANEKEFRYQKTSLEALNYQMLYEQDMVVLHELRYLPEALVRALKQWMLEGGTLLVIPHQEVDTKSYEQLLGYFQLSAPQLENEILSAPDYKSFFYEEVFSRAESRVDMPRASKRYTWRVADRKNILAFPNRRPFLALSQARGSVAVLMSPLRESSTDFMEHPLFVPTLYRLARQADTQHRGTSFTTEDKVFAPPFLADKEVVAPPPPFLLHTPQGHTEVLDARRLRKGYELMGRIDRPGFYQVMQDEKQLGELAFNLPVSESWLQQLTKNDLLSHIKQATLLDEQAFFSNQDTKGWASHAGYALWRYALGLSLIALLSEVIYLRYFWKRGTAT